MNFLEVYPPKRATCITEINISKKSRFSMDFLKTCPPKTATCITPNQYFEEIPENHDFQWNLPQFRLIQVAIFRFLGISWNFMIFKEFSWDLPPFQLCFYSVFRFLEISWFPKNFHGIYLNSSFVFPAKPAPGPPRRILLKNINLARDRCPK